MSGVSIGSNYKVAKRISDVYIKKDGGVTRGPVEVGTIFKITEKSESVMGTSYVGQQLSPERPKDSPIIAMFWDMSFDDKSLVKSSMGGRTRTRRNKSRKNKSRRNKRKSYFGY
jgi:hypothetical protein